MNEPPIKIVHWLIFSEEEYEFGKWYFSFLQGLSEHNPQASPPRAEVRHLS